MTTEAGAVRAHGVTGGAAAAQPVTSAGSGLLVVETSRWRGARAAALLPGMLIGLGMIVSSAVDIAGQWMVALFDDAMISMTYARTLAESGELVWYPGAERVEGITNPGYTLIMTVPHLLGLDGSSAVLFMSLFGLAAVLAAGYLTGGLALRVHSTRLVAVATTITVSCSFPLLFWSVFGLEVGLLAALAAGLVSLALSARAAGFPVRTLVAMAGLIVVGTVVRPDFAIAAVVVGLWSIGQPTGGSASRGARALVLLGSTAAVLAAVTAARYLYYGALTPNTYDLKMGNSELADRLARAWFVDTEGLWLVALGALAILVLHRTRGRAKHQTILLIAALAAIQVLYTFYTGGDTFHPDRFLVPTAMFVAALLIPAAASLRELRLPAGLLVAASGAIAVVVVWRTVPSGGRWIALLVLFLAVAVALTVQSEGGSVMDRLSVVAPVACAAAAMLALTAGNDIMGYRGWVATGAALDPLDRVAMAHAQDLSEITEPDAVIALYGAGAVPYWTRREPIDLLGKSDRVIARQDRRSEFLPGHDKWDYSRSILQMRPDLIDADLLNPDDAVNTTFPQSASEAAGLEEQYKRICTPSGLALAVRRDTTRLDTSAFSDCPLP